MHVKILLKNQMHVFSFTPQVPASYALKMQKMQREREREKKEKKLGAPSNSKVEECDMHVAISST